MDGKELSNSDIKYTIQNQPPNPLKRKRINEILPLGVKAIDGLLTVGKGQRLGIFLKWRRKKHTTRNDC